MASVVSREAYFDTGLEVLADAGFGGLKLAVVCNRLGVTTGSFYHYFSNWGHYTRELIEHWGQSTHKRVAALQAITDPTDRIRKITHVGLNLPHEADAAIRTWASVDPEVRAAQVEVDFERFEVIRTAAREIVRNDRQSRIFAELAVYLLTGYEQSTLPHQSEDLAWMFNRLIDDLIGGHWAEPSSPEVVTDGAEPA
ncbi:TetR/AcrR family transcriptional regulator [Mycolicibacterium fallax]|jgi:AcrR family transcriptional regulator|uniref:TetR family transcriptional regulator n=1 Tax=Mycolicibacterium fallax TaxID=1793 RepID=A0A1X1R5K8_MYCFA|nr:TetR/AcrR family transcriptional regulator [Mycolicibacterium fallax]ORV00030.1 TetR family transcriptional regulator [Mycolicibacterium fallax]BBY99086.1 transcriptional regulator [Mycolicibacterium fallax]HOW94223.1 TetR/AcrR family transcriptional regulator [Mycolicibacterium fallax]HSA39209.1 TetR/AcrR family transcriptional regulator [Mycobacterium sp.]